MINRLITIKRSNITINYNPRVIASRINSIIMQVDQKYISSVVAIRVCCLMKYVLTNDSIIGVHMQCSDYSYTPVIDGLLRIYKEKSKICN